MNECVLSLKISNNDLPKFSKIITHTLTNTQWQLHCIRYKKYLTSYLKLIRKPGCVQSIKLDGIFRINDSSEANIHAIEFVKKFTESDAIGSKLAPLRLIENWKEIQIHCCFSIHLINDEPWCDALSFLKPNISQRKVVCHFNVVCKKKHRKLSTNYKSQTTNYKITQSHKTKMRIATIVMLKIVIKQKI